LEIVSLIGSTSAVDCLETVTEMNNYMSRGMLDSTHSLAVKSCVLVLLCVLVCLVVCVLVLLCVLVCLVVCVLVLSCVLVRSCTGQQTCRRSVFAFFVRSVKRKINS